MRSAGDAAYFIAWIDYNTPEERAAVLKLLADARAVFSERAVR